MKLLRWSLVATLAAVMGLTLLGSLQASAQGYPQVANLTPFTAEAQYMSLPGYLRWQVFVEQGKWISRDEAVEIVNSQMGK